MNVNLTNIFGTDYKVSFSEKGYQALNDQLTNNYSAIFLLVDKNTKKYCLPHFLVGGNAGWLLVPNCCTGSIFGGTASPLR